MNYFNRNIKMNKFGELGEGLIKDIKKFSYILGLFYSDGYLTTQIIQNKYKQERLGICLIDKEVIEFISNEIGRNGDFETRRFKHLNPNKNDMYIVRTTNKDIINLFKFYGLTERKSQKDVHLPSNIDLDSFLLGYVEGDGCIDKSKVRITCKSKVFLQDIIDSYNDFKFGLVKVGGSYNLEVRGGKQERKRFLDRLYNTGQARMTRKIEKYNIFYG